MVSVSRNHLTSHANESFQNDPEQLPTPSSTEPSGSSPLDQPVLVLTIPSSPKEPGPSLWSIA